MEGREGEGKAREGNPQGAGAVEDWGGRKKGGLVRERDRERG